MLVIKTVGTCVCTGKYSHNLIKNNNKTVYLHYWNVKHFEDRISKFPLNYVRVDMFKL